MDLDDTQHGIRIYLEGKESLNDSDLRQTSWLTNMHLATLILDWYTYEL